MCWKELSGGREGGEDWRNVKWTRELLTEDDQLYTVHPDAVDVKAHVLD